MFLDNQNEDDTQAQFAPLQMSVHMYRRKNQNETISLLYEARITL